MMLQFAIHLWHAIIEKELILRATIFCFSKFDVAHDLVQALGNDTA